MPATPTRSNLRRGPKVDEARDEWIRKLVASGATQRLISQRTGLSESGVYKALRRLRLKLAPDIGRATQARLRSEARDQLIRDLVAEGLNAIDIGLKVGMRASSVRDAVRRLGLTLTNKHRTRLSYREDALRARAKPKAPDNVEDLILLNDIADAVRRIETGEKVPHVAAHFGWSEADTISRFLAAVTPLQAAA